MRFWLGFQSDTENSTKATAAEEPKLPCTAKSKSYRPNDTVSDLGGSRAVPRIVGA